MTGARPRLYTTGGRRTANVLSQKVQTISRKQNWEVTETLHAETEVCVTKKGL